MKQNCQDMRFVAKIKFTGIDRWDIGRAIGRRSIRSESKWHDESMHIVTKITDSARRVWLFEYDESIKPQRRLPEGKVVEADEGYSVLMTTPTLYGTEGIDELRQLIQKLEDAGAFTNETCAIDVWMEPAEGCSMDENDLLSLFSLGDLFQN